VYRQALLMAGDPSYASARMQGDPLLGLGALVSRAVPLLRRVGGKIAGKLLPIGRRVAKSRVTKGVAIGVTSGAGFALGEKILKGGAGAGGGGRRRMNVTNSRALRRAIRRVSGFGKLVTRVKKTVALANTAVGNRRMARKIRRGR